MKIAIPLLKLTINFHFLHNNPIITGKLMKHTQKKIENKKRKIKGDKQRVIDQKIYKKIF